jgi:hypothetical protein
VINIRIFLIKCEYGNDTQEKVNKAGMLWRLYKKGVNNMEKYKIDELPSAWDTLDKIDEWYPPSRWEKFKRLFWYDLEYWFIDKWYKIKGQ